jgi:uncharacterized membrane protein YraQ (UPF0718 family)
MDWHREARWFAGGVALFAAVCWLPVGSARFDGALLESLHLLKWYAREHVLLCLVPAFFIAGAITVFVSQDSVMKYLGPRASRPLAYGVASVSGTVLAVCSCTVLPMFAGIYKRGAGLGPATAFLYSGPAINVLAIVLTARVLGVEMGVARALGAIAFSVILGLIMQALFRSEETLRTNALPQMPAPDTRRTLPQEAVFFGALVGVLVLPNWADPAGPGGFSSFVFDHKWSLTAFSLVVVAVSLATTRSATDTSEWLAATWEYARQIVPLLFAGVLVAGLLLGRPGHEGLIPSRWVTQAVGGNSLGANLFAALAGAFMYFATLTEVPIVQGLMGSGMGQGPALALLLAGPALSLPSMLVLRSVLGTAKTVTYIGLVVIVSALTGWTFGALI